MHTLLDGILTVLWVLLQLTAGVIALLVTALAWGLFGLKRVGKFLLALCILPFLLLAGAALFVIAIMDGCEEMRRASRWKP